tara:strand:- start:10783 stop:10962 length:180 start_codon:yes stop_codon:yes gene_type:complete
MKIFNLDDLKVIFASSTGIGNWLIEIDLLLKVAISLASLAYILLKCRELIQNRNNNKEN